MGKLDTQEATVAVPLPGLEQLAAGKCLPKQPCAAIAMTLVEVFCPAWYERVLDTEAAPPSSEELAVPANIRRTFPDKLHWYDAGGSGTSIIYGCELSRAIKPEERQALLQAKQDGVIWHYQIMTK